MHQSPLYHLSSHKVGVLCIWGGHSKKISIPFPRTQLPTSFNSHASGQVNYNHPSVQQRSDKRPILTPAPAVLKVSFDTPTPNSVLPSSRLIARKHTPFIPLCVLRFGATAPVEPTTNQLIGLWAPYSWRLANLFSRPDRAFISEETSRIECTDP